MVEGQKDLDVRRFELESDLHFARLDLHRLKTEAEIRQRDEELRGEAERLQIERERMALEGRKSSLTLNPLVLGVAAAFVGLMSNALVAWIDAGKERDLERVKAESERVLEALRTDGDVRMALENLTLLAGAGLVPSYEEKLRIYLADIEARREATGDPTLGPGIATGGGRDRSPEAGFERFDDAGELAPSLASIGDSGSAVLRVQEWLLVSGYTVPVDGMFGSETDAALRQFAEQHALPYEGRITEAIDAILKEPLARATAVSEGGTQSFPAVLAQLARQHAAERPVEIAGNNRGPWVRYYCGGIHGDAAAWSGCFVSRLIQDAATVSELAAPLEPNLSFAGLAASAQQRGWLIEAADEILQPAVGDVALMRPGPTGRPSHGGIVVAVADGAVTMVEGNVKGDPNRNVAGVYAMTRQIEDLVGVIRIPAEPDE